MLCRSRRSQPGNVTRVLEPIWFTKAETAARVRGRIEVVLDYAKVHGWRAGENPARWKGHLENVLPARGKVAKVEHHAALPWPEIGAFMAKLRDEDGIAARALEYADLAMAARTGRGAIGATWPEIDMPAGLWTVPGARMKAGREHRVPLSDAAMAVLKAMAPLRNDDAGSWIFPGVRKDQHLSNMGMMMLLRRMKCDDLTVHGFRSTFRDWCSEATNHPREVAEQALAHTLSDKVEAAYRRGDLFEKRRRLMENWATFCAGKVAPANVILILVPGGHPHSSGQEGEGRVLQRPLAGRREHGGLNHEQGGGSLTATARGVQKQRGLLPGCRAELRC